MDANNNENDETLNTSGGRVAKLFIFIFIWTVLLWTIVAAYYWLITRQEAPRSHDEDELEDDAENDYLQKLSSEKKRAFFEEMLPTKVRQYFK
eukprot:7458687-Ditylum_brightwellii.AAC.1